MIPDRDDIASAIAAADVGGWGSTLDLDAAVENVVDLFNSHGQPEGPTPGLLPLVLLREMTDDEPCSYDHDGLCQAHNLDARPCPHERARALLAKAHEHSWQLVGEPFRRACEVCGLKAPLSGSSTTEGSA